VSGGQTVVVTTVPTITVTHAVAMGTVPVQTTCPNCHASIVTTVMYQVGGLTWLIFAILCFVGCWICAFIPFCVDDCKDAVHSCPNCQAVIGCHRRL
jgi:lipopolysaccharide-induced tumor necrosis factor-alpha factor